MNIKNVIALLSAIENTDKVTQNTLKNKHVGSFVIVRTYSAGVFYGKIVERDGDEIVMDNCRRIYSWSGSFTLSHVALHGVKEAKLTDSTNDHFIKGVIELIPLTQPAKGNLDNIKTHEI